MSNPAEETVSIVIPTRNRPKQLAEAVESAWAQTCPPHEVIVVVDGPETGAAVSLRPETRVIRLPASVGGAEARNIGVRAATGKWVAFLDDDDLWLAQKLLVQFACAQDFSGDFEPVLSCHVLARAPGWEETWPRTPYRPGQPMSEYLFCRQGWRYGSALLQTSTLVAPRSLLLRVPFSPGLKKHQDWDWLLRAASEPGVRVRLVGTEPLAVFHVEGERNSVGRVADWQFSLEWAASRRALFTPEAWKAFLATECAAQAGSAPLGERAALLRIALEGGLRPDKELLRMLAFLAVPQKMRRKVRSFSQLVRAWFPEKIAGVGR